MAGDQRGSIFTQTQVTSGIVCGPGQCLGFGERACGHHPIKRYARPRQYSPRRHRLLSVREGWKRIISAKRGLAVAQRI